MKKLIYAVLIIVICSFSLKCYAEDSVVIENKNPEDSITDLQNKQKQIQGQIEQSGKDLNDLSDELTENLEQVQKIDEKIEKAQNELEEINKKIEELNKTIEKQDEKLKKATKKYEKQKKIAEARLVAMYESGETEYLDVILSSTDLSEFISSYAVLSEVAAYDKEILDGVEEQKTIMEMVSATLSENKEQLTILQKNQITNKKILENTKTLRENYVVKLSAKEQEIQKQIDEYKTQFQQVNKEILQIALASGVNTEYIGGEMTWPVPGYSQITSTYGMRTHPITGIYKLHTGVDISAPIGANFVAANDGIVTQAYYNSAYGNMVMIDHGGGISTLYAHGSEILVQVGQTVTKGEPILKVGSTGYSTGPHAHFEVRINGVVTNPMDYITNSNP